MSSSVSHPILDQILNKLPQDEQAGVDAAFAGVPCSFEFCTWIDACRFPEIGGAARQRGLVLWKEVSPAGALLYGAGEVSDDQLSETLSWLGAITAHGHKGFACAIHALGVNRLIEFDSSQVSPPLGSTLYRTKRSVGILLSLGVAASAAALALSFSTRSVENAAPYSSEVSGAVAAPSEPQPLDAVCSVSAREREP